MSSLSLTALSCLLAGLLLSAALLALTIPRYRRKWNSPAAPDDSAHLPILHYTYRLSA